MPTEKIPQQIDVNSGRIFDRMSRIFIDVPELVPLWNAVVLKISPDGKFSESQFIELCNELSIRPESLKEWGDDFFDSEYPMIVKIIRGRSSLSPNATE